MDDVFDEEASELVVANKSWEKMESNFLNDGLREGLTDGKENILQESFNEGYHQGYSSVHPLATLRGIISALHSLELCPELTGRMSSALNEMENAESKCVESNTVYAAGNLVNDVREKENTFQWLKAECRKLALQNDLAALCEILDSINL